MNYQRFLEAPTGNICDAVGGEVLRAGGTTAELLGLMDKLGL